MQEKVVLDRSPILGLHESHVHTPDQDPGQDLNRGAGQRPILHQDLAQGPDHGLPARSTRVQDPGARIIKEDPLCQGEKDIMEVGMTHQGRIALVFSG